MTRQFVFAALGLLLTHALSWAEPQHVADTRIESATLISKTGVREVALPHALDTKDIEAQGSRVLYRMKIELAQIPDRPLGIYIGKVSLSGRVSLNGQWTEPCGYGELEDLRCLHRPFLFRPAVQTWQAGTNWLEVEVYGTPMQVNGLSSIRVGDAQALYREVYIPKLWLSITTKEFLAIAAVVLGLLSLAIGLTWREASIYRWYAGMCLMFAASSFNLVSDQVAMPIDWVNRIVISTRLGAALLALLTSLSFFDKLKNWHIVFALFYGLGTLTLAEIFDENRWLIAAAYVPVLATTLAISVLSMVWSWESKSKWQLTMSLNYFLLMGVGVGDWMSYGGLQSFEYVYMLPYAFSIFLLFIGLSVASQLTASLRRTRELSSNLEAQVHSRTLELASALETIQQIERTALKVTESIPVGTYVLEVTPQGQPCFTFLSKRWLEMLDVNREEVMAQPEVAFRCIHPEDHDGFMAQNREVFLHPRPFSWEGRVVVKGQTRWLKVESIPRALPDGCTAFEGVMSDITQQKEAQAALLQSQALLTEAAVQQSKVEQREQLLQDMHDGFGSQLVTARLMAEQGQLSPQELSVLLQECMSDLHLVTDTLSHSGNTLQDALFDLKFRIEKRTEHLPFQMRWSIDSETQTHFSSNTILQLLRVVQEAINNAIKHAQAQHIDIELAREPGQDRLCIKVIDDGKGYPAHPRAGRGTQNMEKRTRLAGGTLTIRANHPGTCVELCLPLGETNGLTEGLDSVTRT